AGGRGRAASRGPGPGEALRASPGQGAGGDRGDGGPGQGRGGRPRGRRFRDHGAHRRARGRGARGCRRAVTTLRRGRCGHDLRRGAHDAGRVPALHGRGDGARARQSHGVRAHAAVHDRRACVGGRAPRAVSLVREPRDGRGRGCRLSRDPARRHPEGGDRPHADTRRAVRGAWLPCVRRAARSPFRGAGPHANRWRILMNATESRSKKAGGLAGVSAGETALCTVGKEGAGLTYRGYDIYDLAEHASFEEVAHLLLHGKLPNVAELEAFVARQKKLRGLPEALRGVLELIPGNSHPMDVLRTGVSLLGNLEPEKDFSQQVEIAERLLACLPSMLLYWHRWHADGKRIDVETDEDGVAGHFLHLLHDRPPSESHEKALDTTLILYAEHEFNASTFAARVITATLSDFHSAITGAIGALRGPLH